MVPISLVKSIHSVVVLSSGMKTGEEDHRDGRDGVVGEICEFNLFIFL